MWTGLVLVGRGVSVVYFPTLCVWSGVCVCVQAAGPAGPMQAESRQMQSDTCVCRMVFVVTLWPQIIKCSPWGDSSRQAPQWNSLTQKEREGDGEIDESARAEERKDGCKERQSASTLRWVRKKDFQTFKMTWVVRECERVTKQREHLQCVSFHWIKMLELAFKWCHAEE